MSTTQLFAINTSHGNLSLKAGYIRIAVGGYAQVYESDKDHPDFKDAFAKKWIDYSDVEPIAGSRPTIKPIEFVQPIQGMTAEELKADNERNKDIAKDPIGTSEALGQSEATAGEATVTKFGEEPVAESEVKAEAKSGRGKKAAA